MASLSNKPIYLITDGGPCRISGRLTDTIEASLRGAGGKIGYVQLREQVFGSDAPATDRELLELIKEMRPLVEEYGAQLVINRRLDLCRAGAVTAVHLGSNSIDPKSGRDFLGTDCTIGFSAHSSAELAFAVGNGADYVLFGPIFKPLSKSSTRAVLGVSQLKEAVGTSKIPIYALGGVNSSNAKDCLMAGAAGVAVIANIFCSADPYVAARKLVDSLK